MIMKQDLVLEKLISLVQRIYKESIGNEASFENMPDSKTSLGTLLTSDNKEWKPEMPKMLGVFHAYVKDIHRKVRLHKLFIIVSGGKLFTQNFLPTSQTRSNVSRDLSVAMTKVIEPTSGKQSVVVWLFVYLQSFYHIL
jgi:hypothetical protein